MAKRERDEAGMTRREALSLLGIAAGAAVGARASAGQVPAFAADVSWHGRGVVPAPPAFPRGAIIRTLIKDVPSDALAGGPTLFHEHLSINLSNDGAPHYTAD